MISVRRRVATTARRADRSLPHDGAYARVYSVVRSIPRGKVATYGRVASLAGYPRAPRLAGYALYALPEGTPLPWHRVVGAGGRLSLARLSPDGALTQRMRLEREGVRFTARGRVELRAFAWAPRREAERRKAPRRKRRRRPRAG